MTGIPDHYFVRNLSQSASPETDRPRLGMGLPPVSRWFARNDIPGPQNSIPNQEALSLLVAHYLACFN